MKQKYELYEIVQVAATESTISHNVAGLEGAVLGVSQNEIGDWSYSIHLYSTGEVWFFPEEELEPTGKKDKYESFYDGSSVTVSVDLETGEGRIVN